MKHSECLWDASGSLNCQKKTNEQFASEPFADMAQLGENCTNRTCEDGTCFRREGEKEFYCRKVLYENEYGCSSFANTVCVQGLSCKQDQCKNEKTTTQTSTDPSQVTRQPPSNQVLVVYDNPDQNNGNDMMWIWVVVGLIVALILLGILAYVILRMFAR